MRDYDEAYAAATEGSPFSNGTQGEMWTSNWCDTCIHDKGARDGTNDQGCSLLLIGLMGRTPTEWIAQEWVGNKPPVDDYHCTEYREDDDPWDDDKPKDVPPAPPHVECVGQTDIVDAYLDDAFADLTGVPEGMQLERGARA